MSRNLRPSSRRRRSHSALGRVALKRGPAPAAIGDLVPGGKTLAEVAAVAAELGAADGGPLTLYYGGMTAAYPGTDGKHYFSGQRADEYVMSLER